MDFWPAVNSGGVSGGSKSLSKLMYLPRLIRSCICPDSEGAHEMDAIAASRELRYRLRRLLCFLLWRRHLHVAGTGGR